MNAIFRLLLVLVAALAVVTCCAQVVRAAPCDAAPRETTEAERAATFAEVRAACERFGAAPEVCAALEAVTWRESRGVATVRHTRGRNEDGAGAHGVSWRYHGRRLLPEGATVDDLCDARTSAIVVLALWRSWVARGAKNWTAIQRAYSGRGFANPDRPRADARWCGLLRRFGVACGARLSLADFGTVPTLEQLREHGPESWGD